MKTALVTGISGQDGYYLGKLLCGRGYHVVGTTRNKEQALKRVAPELGAQMDLVELDLLDLAAIEGLVSQVLPDELYNLAAFARGSTMWENPVEIAKVNGLAVAGILEAIRVSSPSTRFCQVSSSEMFGHATISPQTEETGFLPRSPYGAAKLYAHNMVNIYRAHYGLFCCSAVMFNHESRRRPTDFVTRKVTQAAAKIKLGLASKLSLGNLEALRDWGFAGDYMEALWLMLGHDEPMDYVVATGKVHSVRELCEMAFSCVGLDYRNYVIQSDLHFRAGEIMQLVGDSTRLRETLGWRQRVSFEQMIRDMVIHDLESLQAGK